MSKTPAYLITVCSTFLERLELKLVNQETWDHFEAVKKISEDEDLPPTPDAMVEDHSHHFQVDTSQAREELSEMFEGVRWSGTFEADFAQNIAPSRFGGETFFAASVDAANLIRFASTYDLEIVKNLDIFS